MVCKEKLCNLGADYDTVRKSTAEMNKGKTQEPPDQNFITIGAAVSQNLQHSSPEQHKVRRLHPQRDARHVVLSYGTTCSKGFLRA